MSNLSDSSEATIQEQLSILASDEPKARSIQQLSKDVINRIAAGEVIQRPANAVKELLENCLDAGSTQIQITVRDGGLKLLQVQDNGCGIRLADMPILCERFTTSKLREFTDLNSLSTFGFRGEALASLSHVSLLTVTTRTGEQNCAYRLSYRNGNPVGNATPCAGNTGTTVLAEDMFYNTPIRRAALRSAREEFARVAEVVAQYAIHYAPKCGFHLRSSNAGPANTGSDLRTNAGWSRMDAVRTVVGAQVAQNLIPFNCSQPGPSEATQLAIERLGLRYEGLLTTPSQITSGTNPSLKLNLFINNRMVECTAIKRALESSYATVLSRTLQSSPAGASPSARRSLSSPSVFRSVGMRSISAATLFVYLNIQLPAADLDVNVHPTKAEVHFLHEEQIVRGIQDAVEHCLLNCAQVRSFLTQALPLSSMSPHSAPQSTEFGNPSTREKSVTGGSTPSRSGLFRPQETIRIDTREQRLERFVSHITVKSTLRSVHASPKRDSTCNADKSLSQLSEKIEMSRQSPTLDDMDDVALVTKGDEENYPPAYSLSSNIPDSPLRSEEKCSEINSPLSSAPLSGKPVIKTPLTECPKAVASDSSPGLLRPSSTLNIVSQNSTLPPMPKRRLVRLQSVLQMRKRLEQQVDEQARRVLRACKFVGCVNRTCCLVQHEIDLLLVRLQPLTRAFFYQLTVTNFANHAELVFKDPPSLRDLIELTCVGNPDEDPKTQVKRITEVLLRHAPMLWDYFSVRIEQDEDGQAMLHGIPLLLEKYVPDLDRLPILITRLGTEVNWTDEAACFEAVCSILADFYAMSAPLNSESNPCETVEMTGNPSNSSAIPWRWMIEHVVWPAVVSELKPVRGLLYESPPVSAPTSGQLPSTVCFRLTRLTDLYKVFERC